MSYVIGVDPGKTGAIAVLDGNGKFKEFYDMPLLEMQLTTKLKSGKYKVRTEIDVASLVRCFERYSQQDSLVVIERIQGRPSGNSHEEGAQRTPGITSSADFLCGYGMIIGIVAALKLPYELAKPDIWKREMMAGCSKGKDASRQVAMRLYPDVVPHISLKKYHGRAEALLIASYGYRHSRGIAA